ncbi:MAG: hypothetical protein JWR26_887 [Pedosphaera sp.]|nr:hypothetical protein [Pedosphaera sp.]
MNACVGIRADIGGGDGQPTYQSPFTQFRRTSDFKKPADTFVFLDEHPDSINDGLFALLTSTTTAPTAWGDLPASYHNGACGFAFADGHSEIHKWKNDGGTTDKPIRKIDIHTTTISSASPYYDLLWSTYHMSPY